MVVIKEVTLIFGLRKAWFTIYNCSQVGGLNCPSVFLTPFFYEGRSQFHLRAIWWCSVCKCSVRSPSGGQISGGGSLRSTEAVTCLHVSCDPLAEAASFISLTQPESCKIIL